MKTNTCTSCNREYTDYCGYERCPSYIELVNKNYKELQVKIKMSKQVFVKKDCIEKDFNFLAHCKHCLKMVDRENKPVKLKGFTCFICKRILALKCQKKNYKVKQPWKNKLKPH